MRGTQDYPMHEHPFDLIRLTYTTSTHTAPSKPLWILMWGAKRNQLPPTQAEIFYRRRSGQEHTFRFLKGHLLWHQFQTAETLREEHWVRLSCLAYNQLWAARSLAQSWTTPWQRYLPSHPATLCSPSQVQKDFSRILSSLGTPASFPKPRGNSPGRSLGTRLTPRFRRPYIKKHSPRCHCPPHLRADTV